MRVFGSLEREVDVTWARPSLETWGCCLARGYVDTGRGEAWGGETWQTGPRMGGGALAWLQQGPWSLHPGRTLSTQNRGSGPDAERGSRQSR